MEFSKIHHCKPWCCFLSPIAIAKSQSWDLRSLDIQTGRSWLPIQWRIQKLFLQLQKKKIQLKKKETKVAPIEDPEVVPPAQEGDQSCSSRGSRSCSSNSRRRRPKLLLPRFQKLFLQLPETSQRSHPPREELCSPAEDPEVVPPAHDTEEGFTR